MLRIDGEWISLGVYHGKEQGAVQCMIHLCVYTCTSTIHVDVSIFTTFIPLQNGSYPNHVEQRINNLLQAACGVAFLHSSEGGLSVVTHGDIKA